MLPLIVAHGHHIRVIKEDIRRHQDRIGEKPDVDVIGVAGGLILELRHAGGFAELRIAVEDPRELGVLLDVALQEHDIFFRIEAERQQHGVHLHRPAAQLRGLGAHRDRVQVRNAENAVVLLRHFAPVPERAEIIPQRGGTGRLHEAQNGLFLIFSVFHGVASKRFFLIIPQTF